MLKSYLTKLKSLITQTVGLVRQGSLGRNLGRLAVVALILILASTHSAHAGWMDIPIFDWFAQIAALFVNLCLSIASWFVALTGMLLNVSVLLTMNIKDFVDSTPAIYTVWKAIRDITGMFIIFALLYASIRMIIGWDAKLKSVMINIVIAGVLINFSFFITAFLIDASNIVSLQLYKAITPGQASISASLRNSNAAGSGLSAIVTSSFKDGGLSAVFMQALKIQTVFNPKNLDLQNKSTAMTPFRIVFIGVTGIVIMITVGLSFLFAALAFVVRLVLLLMLLAFSPIWCAAYVVPQLKEYSTDYWKTLTAQLTFMPAYLLLMYVAMKIITESNLFNSGAYGNLWQGTDTNGVPTEFVSLAINSVLIIIMLNLPLLAAIKLGASTGGLLDGNKLGALAVWKKVGNWSGKAAYQNTISRGASAISRSEGLKDLASRSPIGALALKGIRGAASDYDKKLGAQVKSRTEFAESLGYDQNAMNTAQSYLRNLNSQLAQAQATGAPTGTLKAAIGNTKRAITDLENRRKQTYVDRTSQRSFGVLGSADTLFTKISRKDKVSAAKLQIPIIQDQITKYKDDLKDTKSDIKQLQQAITNNPTGTGTIAIPAIGPTAMATPTQKAKLDQLLADQVTHTNNINTQEALIDQLKLIK